MRPIEETCEGCDEEVAGISSVGFMAEGGQSLQSLRKMGCVFPVIKNSNQEQISTRIHVLCIMVLCLMMALGACLLEE